MDIPADHVDRDDARTTGTDLDCVAGGRDHATGNVHRGWTVDGSCRNWKPPGHVVGHIDRHRTAALRARVDATVAGDRARPVNQDVAAIASIYPDQDRVSAAVSGLRRVAGSGDGHVSSGAGGDHLDFDAKTSAVNGSGAVDEDISVAIFHHEDSGVVGAHRGVGVHRDIARVRAVGGINAHCVA